MMLVVSIVSADHPLVAPVEIREHPSLPGVPLNVDMAREVMEAALFGAAQGHGLERTSRASRAYRLAQTAEPGTSVALGPVTVSLRQDFLV